MGLRALTKDAEYAVRIQQHLLHFLARNLICTNLERAHASASCGPVCLDTYLYVVIEAVCAPSCPQLPHYQTC